MTRNHKQTGKIFLDCQRFIDKQRNEIKKIREAELLASKQVLALKSINEKLASAIMDIELHSKSPFVKVDPRTDNLKWLKYINEVAGEVINYANESKCCDHPHGLGEDYPHEK